MRNSKTNLSLMLLTLGMILFAGCSSVPTKDIQISTQADPKANLAAYTTYTWAGSVSILRDPTGKWEPPAFDADTEIKFLINRELRKKGMIESATDPDLVVAFAIGVDIEALKLKVNPETDMEEVVEKVPAGGLLVVLVDSETGFATWAGLATAEVQEDIDTETAKARLDYVVTNMLKDLK